MSQSQLGSAFGRALDASAEHVRRVEEEAKMQAMLDALDDADCRNILDATSDDRLSANEVSETCDLALSTTYRKLDLLVDAKLIEERTRVHRSGKHASEYVRLVDSVVVSIGRDGEMELLVSYRDTPG